MTSDLDRRFPGVEVPDSLRGVLLEHPWDLGRLLALDLPVVTLPVDLLAWQLDLPWWRHEDTLFAVSPNEVRARPDLYPEQWERTQRAELSAPVHVRHGARSPVLLDGVHRLLKAASEDQPSLLARSVSADALAAIRS